MPIRLTREIEKLKKRALDLGALVEERFRMSVKSLETGDVALATAVVEGDRDIDQAEVDIEEECLKILALHQPVADHLRYIVAIMKMNNDIERIGDLAVNIAQRSSEIVVQPTFILPFDYHEMARCVGLMLKRSLDALVNMDLSLAYQVCADDDEVDDMRDRIEAQFAQEARKDPTHLECLINMYLVSRHLERIADHATNIAEDVIYMITGEIHRHRGAEFV